MKCQIPFTGKNKKNINLSSAENAQRVVKVKNSSLIFPNTGFDISCDLSPNKNH